MQRRKRSVRVLFCLAVPALAVLACAEAGHFDEADATPDSARPVLPPIMPPIPPPMMGGTTPPNGQPSAPPTAPPGPCSPGLCQQCNESGAVVVPTDDGRCPPVDCNGIVEYARADQGGVPVCQRIVHLASGNRCAGPGVCKAVPDAAACGELRQVEMARAEGACQVIVGCIGAEPGIVSPAPAGTPCDDDGACAPNGTCDTSLTEVCADFLDSESPPRICATGVHPSGDTYCELTSTDGQCATACQRLGTACLAAWSASAQQPCGDASAGSQIGCFDPSPFLRCRCTLP